MARKKQPLSQLAQARQTEIKTLSSEVISHLAKEGKYQELGNLINAINNSHWHQALQIIRNIPEKQWALNHKQKLTY